jgi:hypothetical protein
MNLERINNETFLPLSQNDAREVVGGMAEAVDNPVLTYTELCGATVGEKLVVVKDYE